MRTLKGWMAFAAEGGAAGWAVEVVILVSFFLAVSAVPGVDAARASVMTAINAAVALKLPASMGMVDSLVGALT